VGHAVDGVLVASGLAGVAHRSLQLERGLGGGGGRRLVGKKCSLVRRRAVASVAARRVLADRHLVNPEAEARDRGTMRRACQAERGPSRVGAHHELTALDEGHVVRASRGAR
jgi:hypothetical protein